MKPIIDPMWVFVIENLDNAHTLLFISFIFFIVFAIYSFGMYLYVSDNLKVDILENKNKELEEINSNIQELNEIIYNGTVKLNELVESDEEIKDNIINIKDILIKANNMSKKILSLLKDEFFDNAKNYKNKAIFSFIFSIIILLMNLFVPNTELGYKILVSSQITESNINNSNIDLTVKRIVEEIKNMK